MKRSWCFPFLALILWLAACGGARAKPSPEGLPPTAALPRVVAVLPFEGPQGKPDALQVVRSTLYNNQLSGTTYETLKPPGG